MPRPAKPPMTLKEAKRAHKKEGGFRYTASQMARADRLDAREEKRKKELEKERQRTENKRKREEKLERERVVRQKMLDEGRISVEETWGEVTASQPRLNKFFGQKPALLSSKRMTGIQSIAEEEGMQAAEPATEGQEEKTFRHELHDHSPEDVAEVAPVQDPPKSASLPSVPSSNMKLSQKGRNNHSTVPTSPKPTSSAPCASPKLRELRPSQINSRRLVTSQSLHEIKTESPQSPAGKLRPSSSFPSTVSSRNEVSQGSPTEILLPKNELGSTCRESSKQNQGDDSDQGRRCTSSRCLDEDFTDGIDDETFLMLCATQRSLPDDLSTRENSPTTATLCMTPARYSPRHKASPVSARTSPISKSSVPLSKGLSESFNSVFNEIEDEDFIALAQEVEAEMTMSKQTPPILSAAKKTAPMAPPPLLPSKPRKETYKRQSPGANIKIQKPESPRLQPKGKRRLPWDLPRDDFMDLGPSTQALTLELLEQAEANMR
ncbi:hypothetical protein CLAIMM_12876 [Cladophialophora immunda]|nr:hypothetical protein CLAIMM_12876 [Cladophialophora immunda]